MKYWKMTYNISSDKFHHPLLKSLLEFLFALFREAGIGFYVIGATAREIIMAVHGEQGGRATLDLDIAIAISDWKMFENVETKILKHPIVKKDKTQRQRYLFKEILKFDIVPFGEIKQSDDKIYWPPDESVAMSVLGFEEVQKATEIVQIDEEFEIEVASLSGIFLLKLFAWRDRYQLHNRDADDIAFIIENYLAINHERAVRDYYEQIYLTDSFNSRSAGAMLLGIDVSCIIKKEAGIRKKVKELADTQISLAEESRLLNQMFETNRSFTYEEVLACMKSFLKGFNLNWGE